MSMATDGGAGAAPPADPDLERPAFLELFFDLVYVFALVTLANLLANNPTWIGVAETLVLLLAFSMIWALTVWGADAIDLARPSGQGQIIWVAATSLLLAAVATDAYGDRALLFAIAYLFIHFSTAAYYALAPSAKTLLPGSIRILTWESIAGVGWIGGALVGGSGQLPIWALAVVVEYSAAGFGWPVPGIGRSHARDWRLVSGRVAERYRQFVIVALGVALFVTGTTFSTSDVTLERAWALAVVFGTVVLMWRIYTYRAGELLTDAIARSTNPALLTQFAAVTHLIMVAGIVGAAVTSHLVVGRPWGETPPSWAAVILGSPALYLAGRGVLDFTVFGRISRSRLGGLLLLACVAPAAPLLPPIVVALLAMTVLALIAVANLVSTRRHARMPAPPMRR
ncbi:low temperature requirement protein A [Micromonospora parathelypteridis]|uniref:Low temperature requirement protein LtrA n=1 Tax=Micromonospora parathelypteridis TaxID=1839617 RepID=A0A840W1A3_9ACTN|nr:low temperature requirement protein A [Micromonospora parathelypteridis]MBB5476991.1 low temperature requirement protein LtrA [Micromonospora parathelypteridis]GGO18004.1 membrane protein [Micromonospora parathelypteridis]